MMMARADVGSHWPGGSGGGGGLNPALIMNMAQVHSGEALARRARVHAGLDPPGFLLILH